MRSKALVALGRVVLAKRERVMALEPYDKGLIGTTLHYRDEVRHATDYFADIPELTPAPELLRLAEHLHPGGVFALWSNDPPDEAFERTLASAFATSAAHVVTFDNAFGEHEASNTVYVGVKA